MNLNQARQRSLVAASRRATHGREVTHAALFNACSYGAQAFSPLTSSSSVTPRTAAIVGMREMSGLDRPFSQ